MFVVFSGGLAEEVEEKILHAAFIPFGDIVDINIPLDYESGELQVRCLISISSYIILTHT